MLVSTGYNGHGSMTARRTPTRATFEPNPLSSPNLRVPLIDSPLPSPSLPSITPRHGKKTSPRWKRRLGRLGRLVSWLAGVSVIVWFGLSFLQRSRQPPGPVHFISQDGEAYEILGSDALPDTPAPVLVTDHRGRSRWTVSIPPRAQFPLPPEEYSRICTESMDLARHVEETKGHSAHHHSGHHGYYYEDPNFLDVGDSQRHGLLPLGDAALSSSDMVGGETYTRDLPICDKSLIFVMQTEDAGFGSTLMHLWMAYGLSQKEGRAFFVDDTNWAYGKYTTYFQPPPMPSCRPPPRSQRVPCPHHAKHLLVSSATTTWAFGHAFNDHFEDAHKMGVERQRPIFEMLRSGYEALFRLAGDDARYLETRIDQLRADVDGSQDPESKDKKKEKKKKKGKDDGTIVGIHVRRGDRHPFEYQYQSSYIPLDTYIQAAEDMLSHSTSHSSPLNLFSTSASNSNSNSKSQILISSDDPDVYTSREATELVKAQRFISLASKSSLDADSPAAGGGGGSAVDSNTGWEGGFFSALFWSLGAPPHSRNRHRHAGPWPSQHAKKPSSSSSSSSGGDKKGERSLDESSDDDYDESDFKFQPPETALRLREFVGRAYLLDIAVLGGASDAVVCGVSSVSCRLLGVMMGWDAVVAAKSGGGGGGGQPVWKNVDGSWGWKGIIW